MEQMRMLTLEGFADELSSASPAPGGGAVAALCSSLAASLSSMVFSLTIDKKFYNEYSEDVKSKIVKGHEISNSLKKDFLSLMDEDTTAFNKVMAAFKLPKETDEEKAARSKSIQEAYVAAMEVPLKVARETIRIFEYLEVAAEYGNPNAVSDAGVGALLTLTALEGAILNVRINLGGIKDKELVEKVAAECDELMRTGNDKKKKIMEMVYNKI